ncbi:MAG: hypothetical protein CMH26_00570 [Micavibrio sp.]|nr:hypothetical protein [Micavibrio sp.]|tara:strand:- start:169 stop:819 length:651 start_codon:yes stop_codon:yes gene_type:complete
MTKKNFLIAAAIGLLGLGASALPAAAQTSRLYFAGYLGLNTFNDQKFEEKSTGSTGDFELDNTTSFAGALGIRLSRQLRVEAELSYRNAEIQSMDLGGVGTFDNGGELKSTFAFMNLYYDFDVPWKIQPYVGAGIGYGWHTGEIADSSGSLQNASAEESTIAWNVGGGLKYRPRRDFAFTGSYRYLDSLDLDVGSYNIDYGSHEFRIGAEWDLPYK